MLPGVAWQLPQHLAKGISCALLDHVVSSDTSYRKAFHDWADNHSIVDADLLRLVVHERLAPRH